MSRFFRNRLAAGRLAPDRLAPDRVAMINLLLAVLCACSAVAVVYSTHLSRASYMEKSANQRFIDDLDMQWSRLQIEEGTFSEHGRIERAARQELHMEVPGLQDSIMIPLTDAAQAAVPSAPAREPAGGGNP